MFGKSNSIPLLLPIVYDLANLVREGFLRSDKFQENEKGNKYQFLRRSFNTEPKQVMKEVDFSAPSNLMRDESLHVEDEEPLTREIHENFDNIKPEPLMLILNASRDFATTERPKPQSNLTREEIEDQALSGLNGTFIEQIHDVNGTLITPVPLIGRYRKKGSPGKPPFIRGGPFPEPCERFTGGICINVNDYPVNEIMGSIRRHRHAMEALLAEYRGEIFAKRC